MRLKLVLTTLFTFAALSFAPHGYVFVFEVQPSSLTAKTVASQTAMIMRERLAAAHVPAAVKTISGNLSNNTARRRL
jgi:hypothetical protein